MVALVYTLISMTWFVAANYFVIRKEIPTWLVFVAETIQKLFACLLFKSKTKTEKKETNSDDLEINNNYRLNLNLNRRISMGDLISMKHIFCKCTDCEVKEVAIKNEKEIFNRNLKTLNYLALFVVFLIMLVSNLCIWVAVSIE